MGATYQSGSPLPPFYSTSTRATSCSASLALVVRGWRRAALRPHNVCSRALVTRVELSVNAFVFLIWCVQHPLFEVLFKGRTAARETHCQRRDESRGRFKCKCWIITADHCLCHTPGKFRKNYNKRLSKNGGTSRGMIMNSRLNHCLFELKIQSTCSQNILWYDNCCCE